MAKKRVVSKRSIDDTLGVSDRFYIENNENLSIEQLANDLCKSVELVKSYCEDWIKRNPRNQAVNHLFSRPDKQGKVVCMTEAASMAGDDASRRYITLDDINNAVVDGNVELVRDLKQRYSEQTRNNDIAARERYQGMVHYIRPLED